MPVITCTKRLVSAWCTVVSGLLLSAGVAYAQLPGKAETPDFTMVLSEDGGPYLEFSKALINILANDNVSSLVIDTGKPIPESGVVIAVGMKAAEKVAASEAQFVINVLIPKASHEKLSHDFPMRKDSKHFSAIFLDQPPQRQARLIQALLPEKHDAGLLYSSPPEVLEKLRNELREHGIKLHAERVDTEQPLLEALQNILRSSEVLIALPDAKVYNSSSIRNILLSSYRSGVPLVGFSAGYVKAGALGAIFSTPEQIARQAAMMIRHFKQAQLLPEAQYPREFDVMINEQVAYSLNLQIKNAQLLHDEISNEAKRSP
jgi:ABC-type uncharacterized transport system substrate-binding protein